VMLLLTRRNPRARSTDVQAIHREMLSDRRRTLAYRDALQRCGALIEGKVVLDVGCGTGILSLFAVQAGASRGMLAARANRPWERY